MSPTTGEPELQFESDQVNYLQKQNYQYTLRNTAESTTYIYNV